MGIGSGGRRRSGAVATGAHRLNSSATTLNGRGAKWMHCALAPALAPVPASSQSGAARSDCATGEWREWPHNSILLANGVERVGARRDATATRIGRRCAFRVRRTVTADGQYGARVAAGAGIMCE